jgi:magnesium-transporting ATPase (P-type)
MGDIVPADLHLVEGRAQIDLSTLTGGAHAFRQDRKLVRGAKTISHLGTMICGIVKYPITGLLHRTRWNSANGRSATFTPAQLHSSSPAAMSTLNPFTRIDTHTCPEK